MCPVVPMVTSAVSRVPLEIWTQIITQAMPHGTYDAWADLSDSDLSDSDLFDPDAVHYAMSDVDEALRLWSTCRLVSQKVKAATESAFVHKLMLGNPKAQLYLAIWCPYEDTEHRWGFRVDGDETRDLEFHFGRLWLQGGEKRVAWELAGEDPSAFACLKLWLPGHTYYHGPATLEDNGSWSPVNDNFTGNFLVLGTSWHNIGRFDLQVDEERKEISLLRD